MEVTVSVTFEVQGSSSLVVLFHSVLFASWRSPGCKPATKLPGVQFQFGAWAGSGGGLGVKARLCEWRRERKDRKTTLITSIIKDLTSCCPTPPPPYSASTFVHNGVLDFTLDFQTKTQSSVLFLKADKQPPFFVIKKKRKRKLETVSQVCGFTSHREHLENSHRM